MQVEDSDDLYSGLIVDFLQFLSPQKYLGHLCATVLLQTYIVSTAIHFSTCVVLHVLCSIVVSGERGPE